MFQIAVTFIGTVVGAGFASGQEIWQFFSSNGWVSLVGIFLTSALFFGFGFYALRLGPRHQVQSFTELLQILLIKKTGLWINALLLLTLLGLNIAMIAGGGTLIHEISGWPLAIGTLLFMLAAYLLLNFGIRGIIVANSLIVPVMLIIIIVSGAMLLIAIPTWHWYLTDSQTILQPTLRQLILTFSYLGFNVGLSLPVLVPLGARYSRVRTQVLGIVFGAVALGLLMLIIHLLMVNHVVDIKRSELPMLLVAKVLPSFMQTGLIVTLGAEIFSTLIANAFGLASELASLTRRSFYFWLLITLLLAYSLSQIGFSRIVGWFYPAFGLFGVLILITLLLQENYRKKV